MFFRILQTAFHSVCQSAFLFLALGPTLGSLGPLGVCLSLQTTSGPQARTLQQGSKSQGDVDCAPQNCLGFSTSSGLLLLGQGFSFSKMGVLRALC